MDPIIGHQQSFTCLGLTHLVDDIENPCKAATELPLEEGIQRAGWVELSPGGILRNVDMSVALIVHRIGSPSPQFLFQQMQVTGKS